jgi:hypothetical protein|tara:strand:- start:369 stop:647 length:279 start_codon:yes stop_codon:yes gene_type:complete
MGMLIKPPKYTRPPELDATNKAIEQRESRAAAEERKQLQQQAARRVAMRRGGIKGLLSPDRENALLGTNDTMIQDENIRNPYGMSSLRGPGA